jgi:hypothetical protein
MKLPRRQFLHLVAGAAALAENDGLKGALVSIDAIATNAAASLESTTGTDKGHGRIEQRTVTVAREVDWLDGDHRFPGEVRLPHVATIIRVASREARRQRRSRSPSARSAGLPSRPGDSRPERPGSSGRVERPLPIRNPILRLVCHALGPTRRRGRAQPLGHREQPSLGARRHIRRRSIPPAQGTWSKKHGCR